MISRAAETTLVCVSLLIGRDYKGRIEAGYPNKTPKIARVLRWTNGAPPEQEREASPLNVFAVAKRGQREYRASSRRSSKTIRFCNEKRRDFIRYLDRGSPPSRSSPPYPDGVSSYRARARVFINPSQNDRRKNRPHRARGAPRAPLMLHPSPHPTARFINVLAHTYRGVRWT